MNQKFKLKLLKIAINTLNNGSYIFKNCCTPEVKNEKESRRTKYLE